MQQTFAIFWAWAKVDIEPHLDQVIISQLPIYLDKLCVFHMKSHGHIFTLPVLVILHRQLPNTVWATPPSLSPFIFFLDVAFETYAKVVSL